MNLPLTKALSGYCFFVVVVLFWSGNFTSSPATQKPLLTSSSKGKKLGCYLGKWKWKLPTAKEQKKIIISISYPIPHKCLLKNNPNGYIPK